jgi:cell division protein FtsI/penicillin-binding protein 2
VLIEVEPENQPASLRLKAHAAMIRASMNCSGHFPDLFRPRAGENPLCRLLLFFAAGLIALMLLIPSVLKAQDNLQTFVNNRMSGRRGAAMVTNPMTGEVLAVRNARLVFGQAFPPGSTAKLVEAAALLEEGKVGPSDNIYCRRVPELLGESHHCSHPQVGFPFDLKTALAYSCNYFFSAMSVRLAAASLAHWYSVFGFGTAVEGWNSKSNPGRVQVPEDARGKARAALGEGTVVATPAQLLLAYSAVATRGKVFRLRKTGKSAEGSPRRLRELKLKPETFAILNEGFEECVGSGTCQAAAVPGVRVAGKTGTATALDGTRSTHAWFVAYAPADSPEIAVVVFLERGTGAGDAAPLAGEILRHYFQPRERKP